MKKGLKYILFLLISVFSLPPFTTYADSKSFSIDNLSIESTLNTSGDLTVSEVYDYNFKGDFNGINRSIDLKGSSSIENIEVSMIEGQTSTLFKDNNTENNGTYKITTDGTLKKLKIFSKNSNKSTKFNIKYTLIGAATKYNDSAELFWKFYDNSSDANVNNLSLKVNFPVGNLIEAKYWSIGPTSGNSQKTDDNTFLFTVSKLNKGDYLGCRILFPADYLKTPHKTVDENAYDRIYNEQVDSKYAPSNKTEGITEKPKFPYVAILLVLTIVSGFIILKSRAKKAYIKELEEYRSKMNFFSEKYYEELPSDLSPALVAYLFKKEIKIKDIIATLMDLSVRNVLKYSSSSYIDTTNSTSSKDNIDSIFEVNYSELYKVSQQEKYLITWLSSYSNNRFFSLKDIVNKTKNRSDAIGFKAKFENWSDLIEMDAKSKPFFILIKNRSNLTNYYYNEYLKWQGFKNFLLNYGRLKQPSFTDLELWKKYLPYALALDICSDIIEFSPSMENAPIMYTDPLFFNVCYSTYIYNDFCVDFERDLRENTIPIKSTSNSHSIFGNDVGFVDGGGFTSGGDSGSCGGGGDSGAF